MKDIVVLGIGETGNDIIDHLRVNCDDRCELISITTTATATLSDLTISLEDIQSEELSCEFLRNSLSSDYKKVVLVTGYREKEIAPFLFHTNSFCTQIKSILLVAGVLPFNFEGKDKRTFAISSSEQLIEHGIETSVFDNQDLLDDIDTDVSLTDAVKVNYQRIYDEVISPLFTIQDVERTTISQAPMSIAKSSKAPLFISIIVGLLLAFIIAIIIATL